MLFNCGCARRSAFDLEPQTKRHPQAPDVVRQRLKAVGEFFVVNNIPVADTIRKAPGEPGRVVHEQFAAKLRRPDRLLFHQVDAVEVLQSEPMVVADLGQRWLTLVLGTHVLIDVTTQSVRAVVKIAGKKTKVRRRKLQRFSGSQHQRVGPWRRCEHQCVVPGCNRYRPCRRPLEPAEKTSLQRFRNRNEQGQIFVRGTPQNVALQPQFRGKFKGFPDGVSLGRNLVVCYAPLGMVVRPFTRLLIKHNVQRRQDVERNGIVRRIADCTAQNQGLVETFDVTGNREPGRVICELLDAAGYAGRLKDDIPSRRGGAEAGR